MTELMRLINESECALTGRSVSIDKLKSAEKQLGLHFSDEYSKYIQRYGCMAIDSKIITGISENSLYHVVSVTELERKYNPDIPLDWYVIEQTNIDGIVIWQNTKGEIFQTMPNAEPIKLCNSLAEYIENY